MSLHESRDFDDLYIVEQPFVPKLELIKQIMRRYNKQNEDVLDHYIIPSKIKCIKPKNTTPSYWKRFLKKSFKKNNTFETLSTSASFPEFSASTSSATSFRLQTSISPLFVES